MTKPSLVGVKEEKKKNDSCIFLLFYSELHSGKRYSLHTYIHLTKRILLTHNYVSKLVYSILKENQNKPCISSQSNI